MWNEILRGRSLYPYRRESRWLHWADRLHSMLGVRELARWGGGTGRSLRNFASGRRPGLGKKCAKTSQQGIRRSLRVFRGSLWIDDRR